MTAGADDFVSVFGVLAEEVLREVQQYNLPEEAACWLRKSLYYNVPGGKMNRGVAVVDTLRILKRGAELSNEEYEKACILGWCVEWLQSFFLVADDIMDDSTTRRGQACWFRVPEVGLIAVNDAFILESCVYRILRNHFRKEAYYADLVDLLHEVTFQTELGQLVDLITAPENNVDLSRFSVEKHRWIVTYKTAYYSFYLPVAMAMLMHGIKDEAAFAQARAVLIPLGEYFQVQDDFLDCYGDPAIIGKVGTDIEDNKCSWMIVQALQRSTREQRKILDANYGCKDAERVAKIKRVYDDLNLRKVFGEYEEESYRRLGRLIAEVDDAVVPREVFASFVRKVYKRTK